jgi:hypothetical protein
VAQIQTKPVIARLADDASQDQSRVQEIQVWT